MQLRICWGSEEVLLFPGNCSNILWRLNVCWSKGAKPWQLTYYRVLNINFSYLVMQYYPPTPYPKTTNRRPDLTLNPKPSEPGRGQACPSLSPETL